jgi:hypothetical protein
LILYSTSTDKQTPPPDAGKFIKLGIVAMIGVIIFATVGNQAVTLSMNFTEFGGGVCLSVEVLYKINLA